MLEQLTGAVLRHRTAVIVVWMVIGVLGIFSAITLPDRLTALTAVPDSQSARVNEVLAEHFNSNNDGTFAIVYPFKQATDPEIEGMKRSLSAAVAEIPNARVLQQRALVGTLYAFVGTPLSLLDAAAQTEQLREALIRNGLKGALVTGPPALEHDVRPVLADDLRNGTAIALGLALLLLVLALGRTRALIVPFAVAGATVAASLTLVLLLTYRFTMVLYIPNVIELIGLGLAIDYSLLVVHRHRRELAASGGDEQHALLRTMATAGRTVALSGITAAVGLSVLFLMPVPFVRSLGAAGLIVPACAVLAALTVQPALLSLLGARGMAARGLPGVLDSVAATRIWTRAGRLVQERPGRVFTAGLLLLVILAAPAAWMRVAPASITSVPGDSESARGVTYLTSRVGPGVVAPHDIIIDLGATGAARTSAGDKARNDFATALSKMPEVFAAVTDTNSMFIDDAGRFQRFLVIGKHGFEEAPTHALVRELRALDLQQFGYPVGSTVMVGGPPAQGVDFLDRVFSASPWIVLASLMLAYLLMARAFRSRLMPLVAVLLNLVSVAAAVGAVALVFRFGMGAALIHVQRTDYLESWALVFLFAMLFGLSMDYQVFLVSRIREAQDAGVPMQQAVAEALAHTGVVISIAAVIFVGALTGLVLGHIAGLQQLGVGLAVGVLIDATIVRTLVLPSALVLLERRHP